MRLARFATLFSRMKFRPRIGVLDESVLRLRVWPNEADLTNVHQAFYLLYMELGRWDLALRMGLAKVMLRERCVGILGGQAIRYKKPLKRFQAFDLRSRIVGWDDKWTFFEHHIEGKRQSYATCHARVTFIGRGGRRVSPAEFSAMAGGPSESPPISREAELLASYCGQGNCSRGQPNVETVS
jgi:acyl-CoA thioesterase FadM